MVDAETLELRPRPSATSQLARQLPVATLAQPAATLALPGASATPQQAVLPTASPTLAVDWSGVDPTGQSVVLWHSLSYLREDALQDILRQFNRSNEWGITVQARYQGDLGELYDKTAQVLNTSESPQLVLVYQEQAIEYWQAQAVVDLNSLVGDPRWGFTQAEQDDFYPGIWSQDEITLLGGARLGIPAYRAMDVLYYNTDWLAELKAAGRIDFKGAPGTPEQFRSAACAAVDQPFSKASAGTAMGYQLSTSASRLASWSFAFGGELFDPATSRFTFDSLPVVEAMQFLQGLFLSGCVELSGENYGDQEDFGAGSLLFTIGTSTGLPFYQQVVDDGARFSWGVAPVPYTGGEPRQNVYGPSFSLLKSTPQAELAAWLFMKYFSSADIQARWSKESDYFPVRQGAAEQLGGFLSVRPASAAVLGLLPFGAYEPNVPGYGSARVLVSEALAAIAGGADAAETLQQLNVEVNAILEGQMAGP